MKSAILILGALAAAFATTGCGEESKGKEQPEVLRAVSVLKDVTGEAPAKEDPTKLVGTLGINDDDLYQGLIFRGGLISSEDRPTTQITIDDADYMFSERIKRVAELKKFRNDVTKAIEALEKMDEDPKRYSMVAKSVAREANALAATKAKDKILICMSDLKESTAEFSYYKRRDYRQAASDPASVAKRFQELYPLPKVENATVYFIYQPRDYPSQQKYDVSLKVMRIWLEGAGFKVVSSPNLIPNG